MEKKFKLENLGCAHCAAKMEDKINKIKGVDATVNFMTQKLIISTDENNFDEVLSKAQAIITKIEPECKIIAN